jgi:hypothetical protein
MKKVLIVIPDFKRDQVGGAKTSFKFILGRKHKSKKFIICSFINDKTNLFPGIKYFLTTFKSIFNFYLFLKKNNFDIIYLNSFFSFYNSILIILICKIFIRKNIKFLLSPRGELFAFYIRVNLKKFFFLKFFKFIYRDFYFIASNNFEKKSISKLINTNSVYIFNDYPSPFYKVKKKTKFPRNKILKIVFLSRITKYKNLLFILKIIKSFKLKLIFDIYGPIIDAEYWAKCKKEIISAPNNILINYKGIVNSTYVQSIFFKYDLFCFPSISENFGHVIYESLASGTPVLCTNNLKYIENIKSNSLNCFFLKKLKNKKEWKNEILKFYELSIKEKIILKKKLILFYKNRIYFDDGIYFNQLIQYLFR